MNYNILSYLIGEGLRNVLRNKKSTFAAFIIMFATMLTVGIGLACAQNVTSMIKELESNVPITVYIKDGLQTSEIEEVEDYIKSINNVNKVEFKSKAEALQDAKDKLADNASLLEKYTENNHPFPASYTITLTDISKSQDVVNQINSQEFMKERIIEIKTQDTVISGLNKLDKGIKFFLIGAGALLISVSIIIIANTIKLAVHSRRREISIMKYVGATNNFIRAPFVVEGVVIGVIATAISLLTLGLLYQLAYSKFYLFFLQTAKATMLGFGDIFQTTAIAFSVLGIGIGVLGSMLSMKKYLKV